MLFWSLTRRDGDRRVHSTRIVGRVDNSGRIGLECAYLRDEFPNIVEFVVRRHSNHSEWRPIVAMPRNGVGGDR